MHMVHGPCYVDVLFKHLLRAFGRTAGLEHDVTGSWRDGEVLLTHQEHTGVILPPPGRVVESHTRRIRHVRPQQGVVPVYL